MYRLTLSKVGEKQRFGVPNNSKLNRRIKDATYCIQKFLSLAGGSLSGKDYAEAFDAACFPLTLFSGAIDPGWAMGISASSVQGLLSLLVEGGADNVDQCFLEAARFGSTELVRILMQVYKL